MNTTQNYDREMKIMGLARVREHSVFEQMRDWQKLNLDIDDIGGQVPCRQAPDLFYPEGGDGTAVSDSQMAKKACQSCEVLNQCATYALKYREEYGIWGGMSFNDRKKLLGLK